MMVMVIVTSNLYDDKHDGTVTVLTEKLKLSEKKSY